MAMLFNAGEVFEIAEQIERNGAKFYRNAAERAGESERKEMLLRLADMEDEHEKTFASMHAEFMNSDPSEWSFDPDGQAAMYLRIFAEGKVFDIKADPWEGMAEDADMKDILEKAILLEKDSIVFYVGIREMVPERLGRDKIDAIIREEMGHVTDLSGQLEGLKDRKGA